MVDANDVYGSIKKDLVEIFELNDPNEVNPGVLLADLGLDSLKAASICAALEFDYDTVVPLEMFAENLSVRDLVSLVEAGCRSAQEESL